MADASQPTRQLPDEGVIVVEVDVSAHHDWERVDPADLKDGDVHFVASTGDHIRRVLRKRSTTTTVAIGCWQLNELLSISDHTSDLHKDLAQNYASDPIGAKHPETHDFYGLTEHEIVDRLVRREMIREAPREHWQAIHCEHQALKQHLCAVLDLPAREEENE